MRENSRFEMMRAVGVKAVASVKMAVPPTMVAVKRTGRRVENGEWRRFLRRRLNSDIDD
jgi:hypothetical protein